MQKPKKAEKLIDHLEGMVLSGQLPAGERIPPIRELNNLFGISFSSTQRALGYLCDKGILKKVGREIYSGGTPCESEDKLIPQITVFIPPNCMYDGYTEAEISGLYFSTLIGIQNAALEHNFTLMVKPLKIEADFNFSKDNLVSSSAGIIILQEIDNVLPSLIPPLPTVGVMVHNDFNGLVSVIDIDPFNMASQAVRYFQANKLSQIYILTDKRPTYMNRARIFQQYLMENGKCQGEIIVNETPHVKDLEIRDDYGYFFTSDTLAQSFFDSFTDHRDISTFIDKHPVLSVDGKRLLNPLFHSFPTLAVDWKKMGKEAFLECASLINNPGRLRRRIYLPGTIVAK